MSKRIYDIIQAVLESFNCHIETEKGYNDEDHYEASVLVHDKDYKQTMRL